MDIINRTVVTILILFSTGVFSQSGLMKYDSRLDSIWSENTYINQISPNGFWVTFTEFFPFQENKLHLAHTKSPELYTFNEGYKQVFASNNEWFGSLAMDGGFSLFNLSSRHLKQIENVLGFDFSTNGKYIGYLKRIENSENELVMEGLEKADTYSIQSVKSFVWDPNQNLRFVQTKESGDQLVVFDPKLKQEKVVQVFPEGSLSNLNYHPALESCVFFLREKGENSIILISDTGQIKRLTPSILKQTFGNAVLSDKRLSFEGDNIFFYRDLPQENKETATAMEIWNTADSWEYPRRVKYKKDLESRLLTGWDVKQNKLFELTTQEKPSLKYAGHPGYCIIYNAMPHEPAFKEYPYVDLYLRNEESNTESLIIETLYDHPDNFSVSSNGKDIVFFQDKDWFWHSLHTSKTFNLTKSLGKEFLEKEIPNFTGLVPKDPAFWSTDGNIVYLTDQNDVWAFNLTNGNKKRITNGAVTGLRYRIRRDVFRNGFSATTEMSGYHQLQDDPIIIEVRNNRMANGFLQYDNGKLRNLIFQNVHINEISGNRNASSFVFKTQRYNQPPAMYVLDTETGVTRMLYQSNLELLNYDFGHAMNITYKNKSGELLNGTLFYPAEFDPAKKYPLILNIYEKKSGDANRFIPPGDFEMTGFSLLKYLTNAYFVFYPDINYEWENPGLSALDCVMSAVREACSIVPEIDKERVGLYGHSFGGYEAVFIPTQTDFFRAVAAGAAPTNFISWYHSMGWLWGKAEIWRFESGQFRMGKSFYEIPEAYIRNSPLHQVEKLKTPLLLWTGKQDYQVNWTQSIELFLAMKRLKKTGRLLLFNDEEHTLSKKENQYKLSHELFAWFEKYLK